jgi:lipoyl(octanoyl) transferase
MSDTPLIIRRLGLRDYEPVWRDMQAFTQRRTAETADELWLVEHPPVYTFGLNAKPEHLLDPGDIPVVRCDRGGQVTYHGPGQVVVYCLIDLRRLGLGVKGFVEKLEQSIIDLLAEYGISAERQAGAPGVYVQGAKIAALGLRITRGASYHGIALNVDMNLEPFARINPCGYPGMAVTQLSALAAGIDCAVIAEQLLQGLAGNLGLSLAT